MQDVTLGYILCCKCGTSILSNPTNMCEACLASECDITASIPKQHTITFCPKCDRFFNPPSQWVPAALESPELLSICLKRVKCLGKGNKLKEASFMYTESHSRKLIIQIVLRGEVGANTMVEQKAYLYYTMHPQQCPDCTRHEAKDYWNACVQIRQRVDHKRTLYYLEQLLLRRSAPRKYNGVKSVRGGLDFFFSLRSDAVAFVEYVSKLVPCRVLTSQQLKSHDVHSNTYNYKFTFCLDVVPVCKNDVVCLPKQFSSRLGLANQILLVNRITDKIRLLDPVSCVTKDVDAQTYYANPFTAISNPRNVTEFFVMDVEGEIHGKTKPSTSGAGVEQFSLKPTGVWVVPSAYLGMEGEDGDQVYARTHLGHVIKIGDLVIGLDLRNANVNHVEFEKIPEDKRPQVVLIQRLCPSSDRQRCRRHRRRILSNGESVVETVTTATTEADAFSATEIEDGDDDDEVASEYSDDEYMDAEEGVAVDALMETGQ
ncbi:60S ribosomal export protein NMD3 [Echinococcus granulosus]|uniref:60S ribosomal export protein NMD3 n=1 Tax=Echinococcus granulosus TaxID=6210 RepID=A0A068WT38_ECHGR|nr:60S ribosomal export protein NMD3 [Echinococcus granulosus]CDS20837.1 nonsense mediated mrna decay protein [Echinococcus granulosus]